MEAAKQTKTKTVLVTVGRTVLIEMEVGSDDQTLDTVYLRGALLKKGPVEGGEIVEIIRDVYHDEIESAWEVVFPDELSDRKASERDDLAVNVNGRILIGSSFRTMDAFKDAVLRTALQT